VRGRRGTRGLRRPVAGRGAGPGGGPRGTRAFRRRPDRRPPDRRRIVNGALPVVTGIGLSALFVLLWLGGILYVRRMRREMGERHVADQTGHLAQLGDRAHSIEAWLALAADLKTTADTLRGLQAEAALAEGTIAGLVNLLVGSLGGYLVESVLTAGTLTPAVAAQAQLELTWVLKQIALTLARLQSVYANTRHVLESVAGFRGLAQMRARFQLSAVRALEQTIDAS